MGRKTLCVWMPCFRTTVEAIGHPAYSVQQLAIYETRCSSRLLIEVSDAAWRAGLRPGMALVEATLRCPKGVYLPDDPSKYDHAFDAVLDVLGRFSPCVEGAVTGLAFADAAGLELLYGPDADLCERVHREIGTATGHMASVGLAAGKFAAEIAVRTAGGRPVTCVQTDDCMYLAEQPVNLLPLPTTALNHLQLLGITTMGEFTALPANAVRSRYGSEGTLALKLARGEDAQPLVGRRQPPVFRESVEFEWDEYNLDRLAFAFQSLAERLAEQLRQHGLMAQRVCGEIDRSDGTSQQFTLNLPEPSAHPHIFRDVTRWYLEASAPPQCSAGSVEEVPLHGPGVVQVHLEVQQLVPLVGKQESLLSNRLDRLTRANHAISHLRVQLGEAALFRTEICHGKRTPEGSTRRIDAYFDSAGTHDESSYMELLPFDIAGARGLTRIFTPPQEARLIEVSGEDYVAFKGVTKKVVARYGPQRLHAGWWVGLTDRDYLHMLLDDGSGLLLYHNRMHGGWFVQGLLD